MQVKHAIFLFVPFDYVTLVVSCIMISIMGFIRLICHSFFIFLIMWVVFLDIW